MWEWLSGLSGGAASFIGSLTGSLIGLLALLMGALFNAHLNRRRDDLLRKEETRIVATAIQAELASVHRTLVDNATDLKTPDQDKDFIIPDLSRRNSVKSQLTSKLGLLDVETV